MSTQRTSARDAARTRHPSARSWSPDRSVIVERLAERARARGASWPRVAAAVVMLRGVTGDDPEGFAQRVGVSPADLAALEAGRSSPAAIPSRLRAVRHLVDWSWVDDDAGERDSRDGDGAVVPIRGSGRSGRE
jgi:hypothetical protein